MKAERNTVATQRAAEGQRMAAQIQSDADRDSRVLIAQAKADVAEIEAKSRIEAANIYKTAYASDPSLYVMLRSLDSLGTVIGSGTTLVLRTDAAPFRALVEGPESTGAGRKAR
jgi:membrane protease subunit HflC